jgi:hypothetical protein
MRNSRHSAALRSGLDYLQLPLVDGFCAESGEWAAAFDFVAIVSLTNFLASCSIALITTGDYLQTRV